MLLTARETSLGENFILLIIYFLSLLVNNY